MADRILVAYATRYGSTAEVAEAIGEELRKAGITVDVQPVGEVQDLSPYRRPSSGADLHGEMAPGIAGLHREKPAVSAHHPGRLLCRGAHGRRRRARYLRKAEASMDQVRMLVNPVEIGIFPGKLESSRLSFTDRAIVTMIRAKTGDFRDWEAIRSWVEAVRSKIAPA
jgi:menaquinone-dependent protoporphyrinogen oxidase